MIARRRNNNVLPTLALAAMILAISIPLGLSWLTPEVDLSNHPMNDCGRNYNLVMKTPANVVRCLSFDEQLVHGMAEEEMAENPELTFNEAVQKVLVDLARLFGYAE